MSRLFSIFMILSFMSLAAQAKATTKVVSHHRGHARRTSKPLHLASPSKPVAGDSKITADVRRIMDREGSTKTGSSFCYAMENGKVQGVNPDKPVRIASVMKILTTFWAVESLGGPDFRFTTKIYYQASNKEMHIEGSQVPDPFFDRDRLFLLIADLNKAGIKQVNRLTADENFDVDYEATESQYNPAYAHKINHAGKALAEDDIKAKLEDGFNTANWWKSKAARYRQARAHSASPALPAELSFKAETVDVVQNNPLAGKPGVVVYEIKSAPLKMYLKQMNILSVNPMADELFAALGGRKEFLLFMKEKMGFELDGVHSGSGLPLANPRVDTTVTCADVVEIVRQLDLDLEKVYNMDLADVMMVAGVDTGGGHATFSDRTRSLIVKTGTVNGGKNLAGVQETNAGAVYFGIFMQHASARKGNVVAALHAMMRDFRAKAVVRASSKFDGLDTDMQLRPLGSKKTTSVIVAKD